MSEQDNFIDNFEEFTTHILEVYPQEACGVLVNGKFTPVENVHPEPINNFLFPEHISKNLLNINGKYRIIHSHTGTFGNKYDIRLPSKADQKGQVSNGMEWGIVHCDGTSVSKILWFGFPSFRELEGRKYIPKVNDCFTLVRDYFYQTKDISVPDVPREIDWELESPELVEDYFKTDIFEEIPLSYELKTNDILLLRLASNRINHCGVYLGDGKFLHHILDRISKKDLVSRWNSHIMKIIRLK